MTKLCKQIVRHRRLFCILLTALECIAFFPPLYTLGWHPIALLLIALLLSLLNWLFVSALQARLLQAPLRVLSKTGDPAPLLRVTEELLSYRLSENDRIQIEINRCVALRDMGELTQVRDVLLSIHIDKKASTLPVTKAVWYSNVADVCELLGETAEARLYAQKAQQIYGDMPNNQFRRMLKNTMEVMEANESLHQGNYPEALGLLSRIETEDMPLQAEIHLLRARIYLAQGNGTEAERALTRAASLGDGLYAVRTAKSMLSEKSNDI